MMTEARRAQLLAYCRLDDTGPWDDAVLDGMYLAAISYMEQAGVSEPPEGSPRRAQYDQCVNALVLDSWDRRGSSDEARSGHTMTENRAFRLSLNQLKLTEPEQEG